MEKIDKALNMLLREYGYKSILNNIYKVIIEKLYEIYGQEIEKESLGTIKNTLFDVITDDLQMQWLTM